MNEIDFGEALKSSGLKNTRIRRDVLGILEQSDRPCTVEQIYFDMKTSGEKASFSTVYRTLEILVEKMLINKLSITGDKRAMYEYNRQSHRHYLVCLKCRKILPIDMCPIRGYEKKLAEKTDFKITGHRLDIYGYCSECLDRNDEKNET